MSKELEDFPEIPKPPHVVRATIYAWDDWMNGKVWALKEKEDFTPTLRVMRQTIAAYALRHGYTVEMKSDLLNRIIYLRASKTGEGKKPATKPKAPTIERKVVSSPPPPAIPMPIDPVATVFGERHERETPRAVPPRTMPGVSIGEKARREW